MDIFLKITLKTHIHTNAKTNQALYSGNGKFIANNYQ